jgi:hypothetical protein
MPRDCLVGTKKTDCEFVHFSPPGDNAWAFRRASLQSFRHPCEGPTLARGPRRSKQSSTQDTAHCSAVRRLLPPAAKPCIAQRRTHPMQESQHRDSCSIAAARWWRRERRGCRSQSGELETLTRLQDSRSEPANPLRDAAWHTRHLKSSGAKTRRISMMSPSSAGQRCAHFTTSSLDGASNSQ